MRSGTVASRRRMGLLGLLALLHLGGGTPNSFAGDGDGLIRYRSSELATDAGARRVLGQIEAAAHLVCFDQEVSPLPLLLARRRCFHAALARAVADVNARKVTAAYVAKYGPPASSGARSAHSTGLKPSAQT